MLPLPKTFLEGFFWNGVQLLRRVLHYLFSTLKTYNVLETAEIYFTSPVTKTEITTVIILMI
jgi:hypothetical protein